MAYTVNLQNLYLYVMSQPATKYITELEYLSYEREAEERHEYYKGEILR